MRLSFRSYGKGPPLIVLHGLFGSSDNWHSAAQQLGVHWKVYAPDQRNHGNSPKSPEMNYGVMAEDVAEFLQQEGLKSCHVLGHSMGGKTAMQFALTYPERVQRLVIVDIAPRAYSPRHDAILQGLLGLQPSRCQTRLQADAALAVAVPDKAVRQFLLKNLQGSPGGGFSWKLGLEQISGSYHLLNDAIRSQPSFHGPVLFVRGESSDYLQATDLAEIKELFPQACLQTIPRAGHWVHVENPGAFQEAVVGFLTGRTCAASEPS